MAILSEIVLTQPESAYACFVRGYQHKLTYSLRTIPGIEKHLSSLEESIRTYFIPAITGGHNVNDKERRLLSLPPRLGGLGIKIFTEVTPIEFENSNHFTKRLQEDITKIATNGEGKTRQQIKREMRQRNNVVLEDLRINMPPDRKRANECNRETGASNWLTSLPIKELG